MSDFPETAVTPGEHREESLWDIAVRSFEFEDDAKRVVIVATRDQPERSEFERFIAHLRAAGVKTKIMFVPSDAEITSLDRQNLVRLIGSLLDDTADGGKSYEGQTLPLPTGLRVSEDAMTQIMSGMPKVGRRSVDIHVYDALRAEVNYIRDEMAAYHEKIQLLTPCEAAELEARHMDWFRTKNGLSSEPALPVCEIHDTNGCPPGFSVAAVCKQCQTTGCPHHTTALAVEPYDIVLDIEDQCVAMLTRGETPTKIEMDEAAMNLFLTHVGERDTYESKAKDEAMLQKINTVFAQCEVVKVSDTGGKPVVK